MEQKQYDDLVEKLGKDAADKIKQQGVELGNTLNEKFKEFQKGTISKQDFDDFKKEMVETNLKSINDQLKKIDDAAKEQGNLINELKEQTSKVKNVRLEDFLKDLFKTDSAGKVVSIVDMREAKKGEFITITGSQMKAAGVTSIGGSVQDMDSPPNSPWLPGLGGSDLELFDIVRNPNFILNHVDVGRTNQSRLAWINETVFEGTVETDISEGGTKPQLQHKFKVEFSTAKKAAAWIELTEEFDTDLPGLATAVRRMLQDDVLRAFDDKIQTEVIAAARPYEITSLNGVIQDANYWSVLRAMIGQIGSYNFNANTIGINPLTAVILDESKNEEGTYLLPPFADRVRGMIVEANKVAFDQVFVGDLKQFKVDLYKDLTVRVGWINEEFIQNKFAILAELRYHSYISDARKKAICYDDMSDVMDQLDSGS